MDNNTHNDYDNFLAKRRMEWVVFIGFVLFLIGMYASVRTIINIFSFDKYPQEGVLAFNLFNMGMMPYAQREQDCLLNPIIYYEENNKTPRLRTSEEAAQDELNKINCLSGIKESRDKAKTNDISQSLLFLFLGIGILSFKKIFRNI